jgi:hypothetical protein
VIDRYSNGEDYFIVIPFSYSGIKFSGKTIKWKEKAKLVFIKFPFLKENPSHSDAEHYLNEIKNIADEELPNIKKDGFLVIQTQDVRINGYIEPLAMRIMDVLSDKNLWLKEIVIVTKEENSVTQNAGEYLKITHQYLLVYEVKNEENF